MAEAFDHETQDLAASYVRIQGALGKAVRSVHVDWSPVSEAGTSLVSVKENIGGNSSSDITTEGVMAAVAEGRKIEIAEEVKRGLERKAQVGGTPHRAPLGYLNVHITVDGRIVRDIALDPERAPLIKEAFSLYATDTYSLEELCAFMAARGLLSNPPARFQPQPLAPTAMSKVLRNK